MDNNEIETLVIDDTSYKTKITKKYLRRKPYMPRNKNSINAFIPGTINEIYIKEGDYLNIGDNLLVLEAMKMRNTMTSHIAARVKKIHIKTGDNVSKDQLLISLES